MNSLGASFESTTVDSEPVSLPLPGMLLKSGIFSEPPVNSSWPPSLLSESLEVSNASLFSSEEEKLIKDLCQCGQAHLFDDWDQLGKCDAEKKEFVSQLMKLNISYPGGLLQYISTARSLLSDAARGVNPLDGWVPEVPIGAVLSPGSPQYEAKEAIGFSELGKVGFVLVAGGLGERLGYSGIKIGLPSESTTGTTYIELYCQQIQAMQTRYCLPGQSLSLAIMVSDDTMSATEALMRANGNFGLDVTLMKQEKVPAISDSNARLAKESKYVLESKPHGHGDVHVLLHSTGTAHKWLARGLKWVVFFQDTNGLAFTTLAAALGMSVEMGLDVNSVTVPRFAKQAVGAIAKLKHTDGREITVNVEYNQLDPLLRATISAAGDVNDPTTGQSIFPGNINQLIFSLEPYEANLRKTSGVMGEFVNAKYTDSTKMAFKKPTRLECLMQDYPKVLDGAAARRVGFTQFPAWACYSPCKNNTADAAVSIQGGVPAGCAWTAESDQYACQAQLLRILGCHVADSPANVAFLQIPAPPGPRIVIHPSTGFFLTELRSRFPNPTNVTISARSTLVVKGDVIIESLELDGALSLIAAPGTQLIVSAAGDGHRVINKGHILTDLNSFPHTEPPRKWSETARMRGFVIEKIEEKVVDTTAYQTSTAEVGHVEVFHFTGEESLSRKRRRP
jgi:UDP-sugar pyrophosphorylase